MKVFLDFYEAWHFLGEHRIFKFKGENNPLKGESNLHRCLDIEVVKVNPDTEEISDDESENIATRVWLECGPWCDASELSKEEKISCPHGVPTHDTELDCGAQTFEQAIVELANLVLKKYGS